MSPPYLYQSSVNVIPDYKVTHCVTTELIRQWTNLISNLLTDAYFTLWVEYKKAAALLY